MKQLNIFTKSVLLAALAVAVTPALADDDDRIYAQNHAQYITHQAAGEKALQQVGGGYVKDVEFEYHDFSKKEYFDVEVIDKKGQEFDVRLDARTGKVIRIKRDD